MTEETTTPETTEENNGINISVEQILAGILQTTGAITIKLEDLVANYGQKTIAVNQNEDKSVKFELVDASVAQAEQTAESAE
jgi:hypothetical protein